MDIETFVGRLSNVRKKGNGYMASCPFHEDHTASLSITSNHTGIGLKCFAGCATEDIVKSMGLTMSDLFVAPPTAKHTTAEKARIVTTYDYKDEAGKLLFQVCRMEPKSFRQRRPLPNGEWDWTIKGVRGVIYHLDQLALQRDDPVYFVEGEKDCDSLWEAGRVATTSPGGANNWKEKYSEFLVNRKVILIPDKDDAGYAYMRNVACSLMGKADLSCILLPDKDVSDWFNAGHHVDELDDMTQDIDVLLGDMQPNYEMLDDAVIWRQKSLIYKAETVRQERTGIHAKASITHNFTPLAWSVFNVERVEERAKLARTAYKNLPKEIAREQSEDAIKREFDLFCAGLWHYHVSHYSPELVYGDEHPAPLTFLLHPYIILGGGTILFAPPGRGKSYSGLLWAQSINEGVHRFWRVEKAPVLYINLERSKQSIQRRLSTINKVLGLPAVTPLRILNARGKSLNDIASACRKAIRHYGIKVIFLDSLSRAGFGGLIDDRPVNNTIDAMSGICETWVALAHSPRGDESHTYGSVMFDAGADIVIRLASEVTNNGTLGVGYEVTKTNDTSMGKQVIWAMEFKEDEGLTGLRRAKPFEFPEIEGKSKQLPLEAIRSFIFSQDDAEATGNDITEGTGLNRGLVSHLLRNSGQFIQTRKAGRSIFYSVSDKTDRGASYG